MTSKDRVRAALRREPADRVPVFMWYHPDTAERLGRLLKIPASCVAEAMGDDVRQRWVGNNYAMEGVRHERDGEGHTDAWGIRWVKDGPFNQIESSPLQDAAEAEIRAYEFPSGDAVDDLMTPMESLRSLADEYFVGCDVSPCAFEMYWRLRGMEGAMMDLAVAPETAAGLLEDCAAFAAMLARKAIGLYELDWLWTGDDVGGQGGMLMSPTMWREMIKPHLAQVVAAGKRAGLPVAYHSCGGIRPIIDDLVEIGVDVLNPIQQNCPGMDALELKREYGDRLAFMGGVDTQGVLPRGTEAEVRAATERLIDGMTAGGGGYILAASHTVPPETPVENLFAMYEVAGISREEILGRAAAIREREGVGR